MNRFIVPLCCAFALEVSTVTAQTLSPTKLSAHLINGYTPGASNIISGQPRVLKVLGTDTGFPAGMVQAMRDYRARVPGGKIVVRVYSPKTYSLADDATASASDFWANILQKGLNYLSPADRGLLDYLEGPNEGQTPTLGYPGSAPLQASQWFNQFWTNLTPLIAGAGYKPCIGSIAVGNPGGTPAEMQSYLAAFVPALRQAKALGGAWSYHAYTIDYTTEPAVEIYYSLRYRQFYSYFAGSYPDLATMPLILTEGGVDQSGDPNLSGWQARGTAADYERWLNWFDQQMQQDPTVLGCTLFEIGNPESWGWPSFDLEPLAGWLGNYLKPPASGPPAPSGVVARAAPGAVTLSWTNPPLNPTTWTVKRSTTDGGPYFTIATNITAGVQATTYTDNTVSSAVTYYYVVTGANTAGEGPSSPQVSAVLAAPSAINCGGPAVGAFQQDAFFDTGTSYSTASGINTSTVQNPGPMAVYQSQRYGNFTYAIPFLTPHTSYKLRLHFAEVFWTTVNQRVFNVIVNGVEVLNNFDIVAAAGAALTANIQEVNAISDDNGLISVRLLTVKDNASINGIELVRNPTNSIPAAPGNLVATVGNALVTLTWSVPQGASSFSLKRSTVSGGPYSVIASNLTQAIYRDPSFVPNTTYYYVVTAVNSLGESAPSLQVGARPTTGLPDVVVTGVTWTPARIFAGNGVIFSAGVLNQGSAPTPAGVTLGVGFNMDGLGTVSWSAGYSASVAPNASVTLPADGGPTGNTWTATPGPHTLIATVNDVNRFAESIQDNNSLYVPLTVYMTGYALNCGGPAVGSFGADSNFAGSLNTFSTTNSVDVSAVPNAGPTSLYQTDRWGEFAYVLNNLVPGSNYTVRLHFAEISPSVNSPGDRKFNLSVNGVQVLTEFDVLGVAGRKFRALTQAIKKTADTNGTLVVSFSRGSAGDPVCSGIQVLGSAPPMQPVITGVTLANALATLQWQASPGAVYQLQAKDELGATWNPQGGFILAPGNSCSVSLPAIAPQQFYRVILIN